LTEVIVDFEALNVDVHDSVFAKRGPCTLVPVILEDKKFVDGDFV